jgi:hypothetical protein
VAEGGLEDNWKVLADFFHIGTVSQSVYPAAGAFVGVLWCVLAED